MIPATDDTRRTPLSATDIQRTRRDTPACQHLIHFNNAGASPMPTPVLNAVTDHLALENRWGGYEAAERAQEAIDGFYGNFADLLNASPDEIACVENATRAWEMAFHALDLQPGEQILTHEAEYVSNYLTFLQAAKTRHITIRLIPTDDTGSVDPSAIEPLITPKTRVIALTHLASQGGPVQPAAAVGRIARAHNLWYFLDACQSAGQLPLDVRHLGCDILSGTGRKFLRGPRGSGFLYVNRAVLHRLHPPFVDLRSADWLSRDQYQWREDARRFETWERSMAGQIGLARAVRYALDLGLEAIQARIQQLTRQLVAGLQAIKGVRLMARTRALSGIVTFATPGHGADALVRALRADGVNLSRITAAHARLDLGARHIPELVRASVHYYNTPTEIERFCQKLAKATQQ